MFFQRGKTKLLCFNNSFGCFLISPNRIFAIFPISFPADFISNFGPFKIFSWFSHQPNWPLGFVIHRSSHFFHRVTTVREMSRRDRRPPFGRGLGPRPHPELLEGMRGFQLQELQFGMGPRMPPGVIEEHLAVQLQEIQGLLVDNQGLAATHVALKQELEAVQQELQRMMHFSGTLHADKDVEMRTMYERLARIEADLCGMKAMKAELLKVKSDVTELTLVRQELTGKVQAMTQDLARAKTDLQHASALKEEIESVKHELQRARSAIEYEKKGYAENYQHGQLMENNLISMAKELEKLRAEIANADKGAGAAASGLNPGYGGNYGNPEAGYAANPYLTNYGVNPVQAGSQSFPQYGPGPGPGYGYSMQQAQGHR